MKNLAAIAAQFGDDPEGEVSRTITHEGQVWRWKSTASDAPAAWFFMTIDGETAATIRAVAGPRRGFGSIRVEAEIGDTRFATSLFPAKDVGGFLLPLKAKVRKAEKLEEGAKVLVALTLS
jgi:Domain of unknown function (DUF1905)